MIEHAAARLAACLEAAGIPYMVIGGLALAVRGEPRMTQDVDVTLGIDASHLDQLLAALAGQFTPAVTTPADFVKRTNVLPVRDDETGLRCDLIFSFISFERDAIDRAESVVLDSDSRIRIVSAEDLIVYKLLAGRPRDVEDVRGILTRQGEGLNRAVVETHLIEFARLIEKPEMVATWRQLTDDV